MFRRNITTTRNNLEMGRAPFGSRRPRRKHSLSRVTGGQETLEARLAMAHLQIHQLSLDHVNLADHSAVTGTDLGGMAISKSHVFYTGNDSTGAFPVNDLNAGTSTGVRYEAIFSDLGSGKVYSLGTDATTPVPPLGGNISHLIQLDAATGVPTGHSVALSQPIRFEWYDSGIFAGNGLVILRNGLTREATTIDISTGSVTSHGFTQISMNQNRSWVNSGVAEQFGGNTYLTYLSNSSLLRTRLSDGETSTVTDLPYLGGMATFTVSPDLQRWYFEFNGCSLGSYCGGPTIGYADANVQTAMRVSGSTPASGAILGNRPTEFTIQLSNPYDASTVAASDLKVNGIPANQVQLTTPSSLTFRYLQSPVKNQGLQTIEIAAGAIASSEDVPPLLAYKANLRYDALPAAVVSTQPTNGAVVPAPLTKIRLNWNEPIDVSSVTASDLVVDQGTVVNVAPVPGRPASFDFTLSDIVREGTLRVSLPAGAVTDVFGNPSVAYQGSYTVDYTNGPWPSPFQSKEPRGGVLYESNFSATISSKNDVDNFTLLADPGQTISVLVQGDAGLRVRTELFLVDENDLISLGKASASRPGSPAYLQTIRIPGTLIDPGIRSRRLQLRVSGLADTVGNYDVQLTLNSALEVETVGSASNDSRATAQDLSNSFFSLSSALPNGNGAERAAVSGYLRPGVAPGDAFFVDQSQNVFGLVRMIHLDHEGNYADEFDLPTSGPGAPIDVEQGRGEDLYVSVLLNSGSAEVLHLDYQGKLLDRIVLGPHTDEPWFDVASDGSLWIGFGDSVKHFSAAGNELASYSVGVGRVKDVAVRSDGQVFVSVSGIGVAKLNLSTSALDFFVTDIDPIGINFRENNELLVASLLAVNRYDSNGQLLSTIDSLPFFLYATDAQTDQQNQVWLSSLFRGVSKRDLAGNTLALANAVFPRGLTVIGSDGPRPSVPTQPDPADYYALPMKAGQSLSLALGAGIGERVAFEIQNAGGLVMATSALVNGSQRIDDFLIPSNGTYYVRVSGDRKSRYSLVATRNISLDEAGNITSTSVGGTQWAMGYITTPLKDFSTGFSNHDGLTANGNARFVGNAARLTDGSFSQRGSFFSSERVPIRAFKNTFTFQILPSQFLSYGAGITFTIQGNDPTQLGAGDEAIGYGDTVFPTVPGIRNSVAIKFDPYNEFGEGGNSTGLFSDGRTPTKPASGSGDRLVDLSATDLNLQSGNPFRVEMSYDGATLIVKITDTVTGANASQSYSIDIAQKIGSTTGFVGFTASSGSGVSVQEILGWKFQPSMIPGDTYQVSLSERKTLELQTYLPGGSVGAPSNSLDPVLRLFDPSGNQIAFDDNSAPDRKNAKLTYRVPRGAGGIYTISVDSSPAALTPSPGDYALSVKEATNYLPPFQATLKNPKTGDRARGILTQLTMSFNDNLLLSTLQPSDLTVDGVPAIGVRTVDGRTAIFDLPPLSEGTRTVRVAAGAIRDVQGTPIRAFMGQFHHDLSAPRIVSSSIQQGSILAPGDLQITLRFSEPMRAENLDRLDFGLSSLNRGIFTDVTSFSFDETKTILTLKYTGVPEDTYRLNLYSGDGRFEDEVGFDLDGETPAWPIPGNVSGNGVEGGDFEITFDLDFGVIPWPAPWSSTTIDGVEFFSSSTFSWSNGANDTDSYEVSVDANQSLAAIVRFPYFDLSQANIVASVGGQILASATATQGHPGVLNIPPRSQPGVITISVTGATMGTYSMQLMLNASLEEESDNGASNDSRATAQNLDANFVQSGVTEHSVLLGRLPLNGIVPNDFFVSSSFGDVTLFDSNGGYVKSFLIPEHFLYDIEQGTGDDLYVGATSSGTPRVLHLDFNGTVLDTIDLPAGDYGSMGLDVSANGDLWVTNLNEGLVHHLTASGALVSTYSFAPGHPFDIAIRPDGQAFVSSTDGGVWQLNPSNGTTNPFADLAWPRGVNFTASGDLWVADLVTGLVRLNGNGEPLQQIDNIYGNHDAQVDTEGSVWAAGNSFFLPKYNDLGQRMGLTAASSSFGLAIIGSDGPEASVAVRVQPDFYSLTLQAGEALRVGLQSFAASLPIVVQLQDANGQILAHGEPNFQGEVISGFVATQTGTYYLRVGGPRNADYTLIISRGPSAPAIAVPALAAATDMAAALSPILGDVSFDGRFDSSDLVAVFQNGEYEDDIAQNSNYEDGDWNGDHEFDSQDLVAAFQSGSYGDMQIASDLVTQVLDELLDDGFASDDLMSDWLDAVEI